MIVDFFPKSESSDEEEDEDESRVIINIVKRGENL